jgi:hypothetical protein
MKINAFLCLVAEEVEESVGKLGTFFFVTLQTGSARASVCFDGKFFRGKMKPRKRKLLTLSVNRDRDYGRRQCGSYIIERERDGNQNYLYNSVSVKLVEEII